MANEPRGVALSSAPASIEEAATIRPENIEHARQTWRKDAPAMHRELVDATLKPDAA